MFKPTPAERFLRKLQALALLCLLAAIAARLDLYLSNLGINL